MNEKLKMSQKDLVLFLVTSGLTYLLGGILVGAMAVAHPLGVWFLIIGMLWAIQYQRACIMELMSRK